MEPRLLNFEIPGAPPLPPLHRIQAYQWGDPRSARTVVCVHGLTRNGRDFDFLAAALAADYRVICLDMPGRGKSDRLPEASYNYATYVADTAFILNQLNLTSFDWIGTSMGGIIGMMLTQVMPGRIHALALNDIGCLIPAAGLKRITGYVGITHRFASRAEAEAALRTLCAPFGISEEAHWQHLFAHSLIDEPDGHVHLAYDPAIAKSLPKLEEIKDIDLWPLMETMKTVPTLLIRGAMSDILTHETAVQMQAAHPRLTLEEIANTGHAPALMADDQIAFIRDWLRSV